LPVDGPALAANATRTFVVAGRCGVPATAKAVALNVTVVNPGDFGDLRLYPAGLPPPGSSSLNFRAGGTRANNAVLLLSTDNLGTLAAQAENVRANLDSIATHTPGASTLTAAELRLLPLLTTHLSFREIGERMYLSRHTVKSHAMSIYRKLDVTSRNAAVERARGLGLL
jgi:DNA-binding CsgD family transcriptional regulator